MKQLKIFGVPVASFGEAPSKSNDIDNVAQVGSLPDPGPVPSRQTKFLSPRYEPSNISQEADVQRIQSAIRQAENGDTQELFRFYRDVLLGDEFIQGCFNTRKLALLAQPLSVLPEDKRNPDDVSLALAMKQAIKDCENWNQGMLALMDSNGFWPNSIVERLYRPAGAEPRPGTVPAPADDGDGAHGVTRPTSPKLQYTLHKFVPVNPQLHCYQWAYMMGGVGLGTGSAIQLSQMAGSADAKIDGTADPASPYRIDLEKWEPYIKLWPIDVAGRVVYDVTRASYLDMERHIVHRGHLLQNFRDNWGGPGRAILMWWLFRGLGRQWFARGMDRFGAPFPVTYVDAKDPTAVALMREALDLSRVIGGLVVDEASRVELKEAMSAGMAQGYETFHRMCNEAISFHITGLRESQKPSGMNAGQSNFAAGVREDVRMFDQILLAETCIKQIVQPFARINGLAGSVKFVWGGLSDADAKTFAEFLVAMNTAGWTPTDDSADTIEDRTGMQFQRVAAPAMQGGTGVSPVDSGVPPESDPDTEPTALSAGNRAHGVTRPTLTWLSAGAAPTPIDDVVAKHQAALGKAFRGALAPVRQIILSSDSRADCERKLKTLFADWPTERISGIVDEAMQVCAARGASEGVAPR